MTGLETLFANTAIDSSLTLTEKKVLCPLIVD